MINSILSLNFLLGSQMMKVCQDISRYAEWYFEMIGLIFYFLTWTYNPSILNAFYTLSFSHLQT